MRVNKLTALITFAALLFCSQQISEAQWYSGSYSTFYGPTTSYYGGAGNCCGSYGSNPFAPLVPGPRFDLFAPFRVNRYFAGYSPYSSYGCGCSPCSTGCASGNCGITTNQPLKPSPDSPPTDNGNVPRTYDDSEMNPMDDPGFRPTVPEESDFGEEGSGDFPGGIESFKPPVEEGNTPANEDDPIVPLEADPTAVDNGQFNFDIPKPITPRNSAQFVPTGHLENKITWRSAPMIVPQRQQLAKSRTLVVRKTVRVVPSQPLTLVSDSRTE